MWTSSKSILWSYQKVFTEIVFGKLTKIDDIFEMLFLEWIYEKHLNFNKISSK